MRTHSAEFVMAMTTLWCTATAPQEAPLSVSVLRPEAGVVVQADSVGIEAEISGAALSAQPCLTAVVTFPDGATERVSLHDDGKFGDERPGDAQFANRLSGLAQAGRYTVRVKGWQAGRVVWSQSVGFSVAPQRRKPTTPAPVWPAALLATLIAAVAVAPVAYLAGRRGSKPVMAEVPVEPQPPSPATPIREAEADGALAARDQRRLFFNSAAEMLVQLPSVRKAVAEGAPLQARDVLPLLAPLDPALERLGLTRIGEPGEEVPFDPTRHQMAGNEPAPERGTPVKVVFVGYLDGDDLLRKAQVRVG